MNTQTSTTHSIRETAKILKVSEMYLRKCILENKLQTTQVYISDKVWRHEISDQEISKFKNRTSNRSSREDNRNKFTIYLTKNEETSLRKLMNENKLEYVSKLLSRSNPSKSK